MSLRRSIGFLWDNQDRIKTNQNRINGGNHNSRGTVLHTVQFL